FEAEWRNRKAKRAGAPAYEPMYDLNDAETAISRLRSCSYEEDIQVAEGVRMRFTDIGHLLGSACIQVWLTEDGVERKIVFSGDVGNTDQPIIKDPQTVDEADYVVVESTYGDRSHEVRPPYTEYLAALIEKTFERGGNLVIPSFAVGRTQELLFFIREIKERGLVKKFPNFPVYVDSPLANEATAIFLQCDIGCLDEETAEMVRAGKNPLMFPGLRVAVSAEESQAINFDTTPKVIISASGMCDAGRIRHHLKHNLWRPECTVLFVGYQAVGTLGRSIIEGAKSVKLFGENIAVKAEISRLPGKSGHADREGLLNWMKGFKNKPEMVFVNHGEDAACVAFTGLLENECGFKAYAPFSGTEFDLKNNLFLACPEGKLIEKKPERDSRAVAAYGKLTDAGDKLLELIKNSEGMSNRDLAAFASQIEALYKKWK
ncbi:MAG: MBL fold metallo-hydrolase, partial [Oscillospiraceae bacterium]|nr:MBL fold metallo-hydrolase [Oscillospiraceae bacterium]